jgi:predicted NBD/HSP70 family sugar kinase
MLDTYHDQMARALAHLINILDPDAVLRLGLEYYGVGR